MQIKAFYYDGKTSDRKQVSISVDDIGFMSIRGDDIAIHQAIADMDFPPQIGRMRYRFCLADGSACETEEADALLAAIAPYRKKNLHQHIHRWENKLRYALFALVFAIASIWGFVHYAIPAIVKRIAAEIPMAVENSLGQESLALFDKAMFYQSEIPQARQEQLLKYFGQIIDTSQYQILFRKSDSIGANAFALPSGIIVFTDGMINLAQDDNELLGVLAHEVGHVQQRHVMRHILQDSITVVLLVMLTGDVGSASSLAASIPAILVQAKHSREFETEADQFAAELLLQHHIPPSHLADLLKRLTEEHKGMDVPDFLSSHPNSEERLHFLNQAKVQLEVGSDN